MSSCSSTGSRMPRSVRLALVLSAAAATLTFASTATSAPPAYYPSGPQANVDETALTGWTQCWTGLYNGSAVIANILAACPGDYLLLAGGPVASTVFDVVAAAPRGDVIFDTGTGNTPHNANGGGWYFNGSWSWGFAGLGDVINRSSCDIASTPNAALRLCWHTSAGSLFGGYRSGANTGLNGSTTFRRAVYTTATPAPAETSARMGYCLNGKFLDLVIGQPAGDDTYKGAVPAIFVQGKGITCDPPPQGYALTGKTTDADSVGYAYDRYAPAS